MLPDARRDCTLETAGECGRPERRPQLLGKSPWLYPNFHSPADGPEPVPAKSTPLVLAAVFPVTPRRQKYPRLCGHGMGRWCMNRRRPLR